MKVKLKDGRILPIEKGSMIALDDRGETLEVNVEDVDSVITDGINWEQRRYEIAKAVMCSAEGDPEQNANYAVACADALIEKLKKGK